jgi:ABC-type branched-subunit amino acid transport system ATPase component
MPTLLEVDGLTKRYGGVTANARLRFVVRPGEIVGVMGPNGAGKTTLFDVISGFTAPDAGRVVFKGEDITGLPPYAISARGLGRTFQRLRPFPDLSFLENVMVGALARTASVARAREEARRCLALVGLEGQADTKASAASTGQRRRIELARILAMRPQLVLLDEPTAGVDPGAVAAMATLLRTLRDREGLTLLIIEHDLPFLTELCDRVIALHLGEKIAEGPPDVVIRDLRVIEAYLGG